MRRKVPESCSVDGENLSSRLLITVRVRRVVNCASAECSSDTWNVVLLVLEYMYVEDDIDVHTSRQAVLYRMELDSDL